MQTSCAFLTVLALALGSSAAFAQSAEQQRLDEIAREAARQFAEARTPLEEQTRTTNPAQPGTRVELTLDEAVKRALERNLEIAVERLNPQTFDWTLASLSSKLPADVQLATSASRSQSQFPRSQTAGGDMLVTETFTGNNGITQNVKWGGGNFAVAFNNNRQEQSDLFATRNPAINANLTAVYVQPLLRNFRIDGNRAAAAHHRSSTRRYPRPRCGRPSCGRWPTRATRIGTTSSRFRRLEVADRSLALSAKLVEDNQARVEVGTLAPLDVVQAQAEQATRRQAVASGSDAVAPLRLS